MSVYNVPRYGVSISVLLYNIFSVFEMQLCFYETAVVSESCSGRALAIDAIAMSCTLVHTGHCDADLSAVAGGRFCNLRLGHVSIGMEKGNNHRLLSESLRLRKNVSNRRPVSITQLEAEVQCGDRYLSCMASLDDQAMGS